MKFSRAAQGSVCLLIAGCASQTYISNPGHYYMNTRNYNEAARIFLAEVPKSKSNELLYLLDGGLALFDAKRYKEAIDVFLKAEKLAEIKDYTSLSEEAAGLATSDNVKTYTGEDYEKVLINIYLALSYSAIGKLEDAQVEARKMNQILHLMISQGKRNYQESPFARYLSGLVWEEAGEWNDAYVDYQYVQKLDPAYPGIGSDLIYLANRLGFHDEERRWRETYPAAPLRPRNFDRTELIVFFERGQGPVKIPRDGNQSSLPKFVVRYSPEFGARVKLEGMPVGKMTSALDIEVTSIRYLEDRIGRIIARKMAAMAVKGAIAAGVGAKSDNRELGWFIFELLQATDTADLRSWRSLPAEIEMMRIPVAPGVHHVSIDVLGSDGGVYRTIDLGAVTLKKNQKLFMTAR